MMESEEIEKEVLSPHLKRILFGITYACTSEKAV